MNILIEGQLVNGPKIGNLMDVRIQLPSTNKPCLPSSKKIGWVFSQTGLFSYKRTLTKLSPAAYNNRRLAIYSLKERELFERELINETR